MDDLLPNGVDNPVHAAAAAEKAQRERVDALIRGANGARDDGRWSEAADLYGEALALAPDRGPIWVQRGNMLKEAGAMADAQSAYERALTLNPDKADTYFQLGHTFKLAGQTDRAIEMFAQTLERDPNARSAAAELARLGAQDRIDRILQRTSPRSRYCHWLWHTVTVLCDGTVTCGLDDPFKQRNHGNLKSSTVREVFNGRSIAELRDKLFSGIACQTCFLYEHADANATALKPSSPYPKRLVIESSIRCNIRCRNSTCDIANDATIHLRREDFMPWPLFCKIIDEAGPHIDELYFYNYGEPFIHPRALDMLAYARKSNPRLQIRTSTNGILLARKGMAERIVEEGLLDWMCFTIGGSDSESYLRYHKAGSFEKAIEGMRGIVEAKRRLGKTRPIVHWRYLVFNWNDSDEHIAEALRLRDEIGVDEFRFMLTQYPIDGQSLRRAPGTPGFDAIAPHVTYEDQYKPDAFREAGLWQEEASSILGSYRWTGKRAVVVARVAAGGAMLRLARPENMLMPQPAAVIRSPWGEQPANIGSVEWGENRIAVPPSFGAGKAQMEIEVEATFSPLRFGDGTDGRDLGVMLCMDGIDVPSNPYRDGARAPGG